MVVYRIGATATTDGVRVGNLFFPGHPLPGGAATERFALFACPWDIKSADGIRLVAADDAGNEAAMPFVDRFTPRTFPAETIPVSDAILNRVIPAILRETGEDRGSPLERFLAREPRGAPAQRRGHCDSRLTFGVALPLEASVPPMPGAR